MHPTSTSLSSAQLSQKHLTHTFFLRKYTHSNCLHCSGAESRSLSLFPHSLDFLFSLEVISSVSCSVVSDSSQCHGLGPAGLFCPWDSPAKNIGVNCHSLLQRIFPTQGSNPGVLHCRQILYCLSFRGRQFLNFYLQP